MKTISATNLRVQLRDLLADLDTGPVTITKHGKVVAVLSAPVEPVEAIEAAPTTEGTSEATDASQSALDACNEAVSDWFTAQRTSVVYEAPDGPVEAVEVISTTEDTSEATDASQSEPEEEAADPLDEFEQRIEDIDADFEAYLSKQVPMDRPMP